MEDEQCNIDELAALLDDDSEDEAGFGTEDARPVAGHNGNEAADTSDDDIDDDELDRLAALVAEEEHGPPSAMNPGKHSPSEPPVGTSDDGIKPKQNTESPVRIKPEPTPDADPAAEKMRLMEERIKMLEAQLTQKTATPAETTQKSPTPNKSVKPAIPSTTSHVSNQQISPKPKKTVSSTGGQPRPKTESNHRDSIRGIHNSPKGHSINSNVKVTPTAVKKEERGRSLNGASQTRPATPKASGVEKKQSSTPKVPRQLKDLEVDLFGADSSPPGSPASSSMPSSSQQTKEEPSTSQHGNAPSKVSQAVPAALQDDDSDWEDLDGEHSSYLNKTGKELDGLLKQTDQNGSRVAHTAKYETNILTNRTPTWGATKPKLSRPSGDDKVRQKEPDDIDVTHDPFSGIRMVKPLVSSTHMKVRMENRRMVKLSTLHTKSKSSLDGDWVTIGVLISKSDPKVSQKGNQYSIWTLSDLANCDQAVKVFLFGESHKTHWKTGIGMVMGLLNPSLMQNTEKYQNKSNEVCLTVDHPQKLMMMGTSRDLGFCKAKTKAGRQCTAFLNKQQGEFCVFHVQSAYRKTSAKRSELQAGHTGVSPKSFEHRVMPKGQTVMYGGQMFSTMNTGAANKKTNKLTMNSLVKHDSTTGKGKMTTLSLHELLPEDRKKLLEAEDARQAKNHKAFHDIIATPTVGSLNLVKHLIKGEEERDSSGGARKETIKIQSIKPSELLKQHQQELQQRRRSQLQRKREQQEQKGQVMIDLDEPPPTAGPSFYGNPLNKMPQLGRGLVNGKSPLRAKNMDGELAKKKAIFKIQSEGGLKKQDPNALKKVKNDEFQKNIKKRLAENDEKDNAEGVSEPGAQPPKKRSRLLGNVDLDDPKIQKLLKTKSKHAQKLTEMEEEKQEAYFQLLEKKEAMEQKMTSIHSMKTKAVTCRQCKYTALSALQSCREQRHSIVTHDAVKKFFECSDCKTRCVALDRYPSNPCERCGGRKFGKSTMMKEKKGPKLPGQELLLRGEELKFLNSMN